VATDGQDWPLAATERAPLLEHDHAKYAPEWRLTPTFMQAIRLSPGVCKTAPQPSCPQPFSCCIWISSGLGLLILRDYGCGDASSLADLDALLLRPLAHG
jgi:hypothetical protein